MNIELDRIIDRLKEAEGRLKTAEAAQILDSFARLYTSCINRDSFGVVPDKRNEKLLPLLDDALVRFLELSFPSK